MKNRLPLFALLLISGVGNLTGCKKTAAGAEDGLVGTWRLTNRQCYCPPNLPVPNETVTFTATTYSFYRNGVLATAGDYRSATATPCGSTSPVPGLQFAPTYPSSPAVRLGTTRAAVTRTGNTLVLDYGSPCDAPRDTYERQ